MEKLNLVLLSVNDWEGLYVNGKLRDEGHRVELESFLTTLVGREIFIESFEDHYLELDEDNQDLDKYGNCFPENLEDVVEYSQLKQNQ